VKVVRRWLAIWLLISILVINPVGLWALDVCAGHGQVAALRSCEEHGALVAEHSYAPHGQVVALRSCEEHSLDEALHPRAGHGPMRVEHAWTQADPTQA